MNHLFNTYGKISETELQEKYDETIKLTYQISEPIDVIFDAVEDLCEIADIAGTAYTPEQKVNIGFLIVSKQRVLRSDVRKWMRKPAADKTWLNFMTHFRQAHQELRDTDATVDELGYHSANAIVEQIVDRLRLENEVEPPPYQTPPNEGNYETPPAPTAPPPPAQANAVQTPTDPNLLLMQQMMQSMQSMQSRLDNLSGGGRGRNRGRGNGGGRGNGRGRNNQNNNGNRRNVSKYCWTHGCCAHGSAECETPGPNHKNEATFNDMMGGSTRGCFWLE